MFKIGEFSKLTQVTIRMLRYYDETGLLNPMETDPYTGYRMYSIEQIPVLNKIVYLRDSGFNVAEIAEALKNGNDGLIVDQLDKKQKEIQHAILMEKEKLKKIQLAKSELQKSRNEMHYNISIKSIPSFQVFSLRRVVPDYYAEGLLWKELSAYAAEKKIPVSNNTFSIYHDLDYREKDVDIEICAPVSRMGESANGFVFRNTEPVPIMAFTMVYGHFKNIAETFLNFAGWLQEHSQYKMSGTSRQIVHRGPWNEENPDLFLTEIQVPMEKI